MKEEIRNGLRIRTHIVSSTKISEDGLLVEKQWKDPDDGNKIKTYNPKINNEVTTGRNYIFNNKLGKVYVDEMVATCFCKRKPNDGGDYVIFHKDGDMGNNHYKNLEWKIRKDAYPYIPARTEEKVKMTHEIYVYKDSRVYQKKEKLSPTIWIGDADTGTVQPIHPLIYYEEKNHWKRIETHLISLEELMAKAGYVDGNELQFKNPVILHRDNDFQNCKSSNLEWTDVSDPRYINYRNKFVDERNELGKKQNGNRWADFMNWKHI